MTPSEVTLDWLLENGVEPVRWESEERGRRSFLGSCPVHGGSDSAHYTERPDYSVLFHCFACPATLADVVESLDGGEKDDGEAAATARPPTERGVQLPAASTITTAKKNPLDWYAAYCGVDRAALENLGVRVDDRGWLEHYWGDLPSGKSREPKAGKAQRTWKDQAWAPLLWPDAVTFPLEEEIWLVEGETDCIVMRAGWKLPAYTSGGADNLPRLDQLRVLHAQGVESVVVAYDSDAAGMKARDTVVQRVREAGMAAKVAEPRDPVMGGPKDWRARWLSDPDATPKPGTAEGALDVWNIGEVPPLQENGLLIDRIEPHDHTILFGDGGVGKGMLAAWWTARAVESGITALVVDYESHASSEWRPRLEKFFTAMGKPELMKRVLIVQPVAPIWDVADTLRQIVEERGVGLVVVDSALYACAGSDAYTPEGATQYSLAIAPLRCGVLTLAHVVKSGENKDKPFGSVFWHNGARLTVSIEAKGYDTPRVVKTVKANRGHNYQLEIDWDWVNTGLPDELDEQDLKLTDTDAFEVAIVSAEQSVGWKPGADRSSAKAEALKLLQHDYPTRKWDKKKVQTYDDRRTRRAGTLTVAGRQP